METQESSPTGAPSHKYHLPGFLAAILFIVLGFLIAGIVFYFKPLSQKTEETQVNADRAITLPPKAVKLSECVPQMGEHWVELENIPRGPFYVTHNKNVIGIEYMFKTSEIPGEDLAKMTLEQSQKYVMDNKLTFRDILRQAIPEHYDWHEDMKIKSWDIEWSAPHAGFVEPHYDVHFWNVDSAYLDAICPDAAFGSELPPAMADELKRLGVPLPGAPAP